jgi:hypothetical protein
MTVGEKLTRFPLVVDKNGDVSERRDNDAMT